MKYTNFDAIKNELASSKAKQISEKINTDVASAGNDIAHLKTQLLAIKFQLKKIYGKDFQNCFLVDYENVGPDGLIGCDLLDEKNFIRIYYSRLNDKIPANALKITSTSNATIEFKQVHFCMKNALDMTLLNDMFDEMIYMSAQNYYIVSKDADYNKALNDFREQGIVIHKITRIKNFTDVPAVTNQSKPINKNKIDNESTTNNKVTDFCKREFQGKKWKSGIGMISNMVFTSKSRMQLMNKIATHYGGKKTKKVMRRIEPLLKELNYK